MNQQTWIPWIGLALALAVTAPVSADWLVTRDGARIETDGPWEERGRLIVFTKADGTLASLRASEIDLEASHALTAEKLAPPEEAPPVAEPPQKKSVLVLTDDDVAHINPASFATEEAEGTEAGEGSGQPQLEVTNWRQSDLEDGGVRIRGTLRNNGEKTAVGITVGVNLLDVQGAVVATQPAVLTARALQPSEMANFQVDFPDVILFNSASFNVEQVEVEFGSPGDAQRAPEAEPPQDGLDQSGS